MELAVLLTPEEARAAGPGLFKRYSRAYVGSGFCQNLLPEARDIGMLHSKGAKTITLATPLFTGAGLKKFEKILKAVLETEKRIEVSVNDLGLLALLRRRYRARVTPLLGRPVSHDYLRMEPSFLKRFLRYYGVKYLESDENSMVRNLPASSKLAVSFHYPLACLAMSRFCPHEGRMDDSCARSCAVGPVKLEDACGEQLILKNGAYFAGNTPCRHKAVKRLVYAPGGSLKL
ncbi:MAG TPA: hypothetical protein DCL44_04900 [Elusimicrobia bacterium]|nr:hypothetical protein [Elusimicrobiota bacterium]